MRIVGTLLNEDQARKFCAFLQRQEIVNSCEMTFDSASGHMTYPIWVHDEDQIDKAIHAFAAFEKNPSDPQFDVPLMAQLQDELPPEQLIVQPRATGRVTSFFLLLCALVFFWNSMEELQMREEGFSEKTFLMTPIQALLLYDIPPPIEALEQLVEKYQLTPGQKIESLSPEVQAQIAALDKTPFWHGFYDWLLLKVKGQDPTAAIGPMFTKIKEGEVWRLFTPAILHKDFLHILFNMIWLWVLGRPVEQRIGGFRTLLLTVAVALFSNTAQYLMGGPFFLGYSGIVMGLAAFIWVREKVAPWEGYPLHRSTILFLVLFVLAMAALQLGSFILLVSSSVEFTPNIANTAHIAGALIGAALGRMRYFAARPIV